MQKITPFLWFDTQAEAAANFYVSIFPDSCIKTIARYGDAGPGPKDSVMTVEFELNGQSFVALNGGPLFQFNSAISFVINCDTQLEVDHYWDKLCAGGSPVQCGWLKDRYGMSWQVVPSVMSKLCSDPDPAKVQRVMAAMMKMVKLDIAELLQARDQA